MKPIKRNSKMIKFCKGLITGFIIFFTLQSLAQNAALPLDAYGVWIRGDTENYKLFDGFKGQRINYEWSDVQPNDSLHFIWDDLQKDLDFARQNNTYVYASIMVGPDSPGWIYKNNLVPKVITTASGEKWPHWPYYLDPDYKRLYFKLIREFAYFLRSQSPEITKRIAFVQGLVGCTGDVDLYKGNAINPDYAISEAQQKEFYLEAFEQFKMHFNDGDDGKKIPLVFNGNAMHPITDPVQWAWINNNIDPNVGFGIKGSAYMRGHHLTLEKEYIDTWKKYLVNPEGMQIFSRGEIDQTHKMMPLYQINKPLNFYWAMISGLNTGLALWDITESAIEYAAGPSNDAAIVRDVFRFFNKHAPQVQPTTANAAYIIFHEGLNSENTTKFPENQYGDASRSNLQRYTTICEAYADRGAKMDDLDAAPEGQVSQRHNQTGFNDAGWSIEEGNYERWIEQIDPDETSRSLFRVRGTIDKNSSIYDRFARSFQTDVDTMYFKYHDELFSTYLPKSLTFTITWLDQNDGSSWAFAYLNKKGELIAKVITGNGDNTWKKQVITINDTNFSQTGSRGANFFLINTDAVSDIFHGIELDILRTGADDGSVSIDSPQNGDEFKLGSSVLVSAASSDDQGIERMRFTLNDQNYTDVISAPYSLTFDNLEIGNHEIKVQLKDSLGYWSVPDSIIISVVPVTDTVFIQSPVNGTEIYLGEDVLVSVFAYDKNGIEKISFNVDGGNKTDDYTAPFQHTFSDLSKGTHTINAVMIDSLGNSILSETLTITVLNLIDSISITSPAYGDTVKYGEAVLVTVYCYDNDGIERIRFKLDDNDNWENVLSPPYEHTFIGLGIGEHVINVQMKDVNGNRMNTEPLNLVVIPRETISVEDIILNYCPDDIISEGITHQLIASVSPGNATNQSVSWSSSNNAVAAVDQNGLVTTISEGSATISVISQDGSFTDECNMTVDIKVNTENIETSRQMVKVYPNPVSKILNFKFAESAPENKIIFYNTTGQKLFEKRTFKKFEQIDISKFNSDKMLMIVKVISEEKIASFKILGTKNKI